jgi:hypothetical protein
MPVYQSASQRAALQAAAELSIDEGDTPFYDSKPIPRLALGEDEEAILAAAGPVRPRELSISSLHAPPALSANVVKATGEAVGSATEQEALRHDRPPSSSSPLSNNGGNPSYHTPSPLTNNSCAYYASAGGNLSSSQRHLEKMAQPRDPHGVPLQPAQPNYGQVLSFADEEERDRRRAEQRLLRAKSPRTPRSSLTPRVTDRHHSFSSSTHASPASPAERSGTAATTSTTPRPRPLSAAQQARLEKLAAPKKYTSPTEEAAEAERLSRPRAAAAAGDRAGSSGVFDRLYASRKHTSSVSEEAAEEAAEEVSSPFSLPPPPPRPRYGATHTPVTAQSTQPQDAVFNRLAQPKNRPQKHRDANGVVEYNPYSPVKRYYGGTTVISAPPTSSAAHGGPSPTIQQTAAAGRGNSRIPKATWDMVDRSALPKSQPSPPAAAATTCACAECRHALPSQTIEVVAQPVSGGSASPAAAAATITTSSTAQPHASHPPASTRPITATTVTTAVAEISAPTVVQSALVKPGGTKPPIVIRTRRYVPPTAEEQAVEESAVPAPQPVEATRRRSAPVSVQRESPSPESRAPVVAAPVAAAAPPPVEVPAKSLAAVVRQCAPVKASVKENTSASASAAVSMVHSVKPLPDTAAAEPVKRAAVQTTRRQSSTSAPRSATEPSNDTPLEATRTSPPRPAPVPAAAPVAAAKVTPTPTVTVAAAATPVVGPVQAPTHTAVQAVKRTPRAPSPVAPAAAPVVSTATLKCAVPTVPSSSSSSCAAVRSPVEVAVVSGAEVGHASDHAAARAEAGDKSLEPGDKKQSDGKAEEEPLWRVAPPTPKSTASPKARPGDSVYDRLAPPPIPEDKLMKHHHMHKKRCVRPPKPEILTDADFACQLEDFSPEPQRPIVVKKKPKTTRKKTAATKKR